ncbi:MAG TPA: carboxypeptidase-like regulatory domain-containing protein [Pyrinomonadaceae bacterium]|nr:carboxypeptidase-like regulatory domain-containing protein [Pyrinomonadaceae bacterium]
MITSLYVRPQSASDKGPPSSISGKITVKDKGVPGVTVRLHLIEPNSGGHTTRHRGVTDDEGNYRIINVPPGNYTVVISAPVFASADQSRPQKTVLVGKGETIENIDFALVRGGVITGRVTDSDGRLLIAEEIYVSPVNKEDPQFYFGRERGRTDDRGIYRIFGLQPGSYRVAAGQDENDGFGGMRGGYKRTFHPDAAEVSKATLVEVKEGSEATNVDITVGRSILKYSASGRIIDGETGRPLPGVSYGVQMFLGSQGSSSMTSGATSNSEGDFKWGNLAPGKYAIFFEPPPNSEWRADPARFEVIDQDVTGLIVKTSKGASASGVIVLEGTNDKAVYASLTKAMLYAHVMNESSTGNSSPSTSINADGSFRFGALQAGTVNFGLFTQQHFNRQRLRIVRIERDGVVYSRGVEIKDSEQVTGLRLVVNYANGTIRGVVTLGKGTPAPDGHFNISLNRVGDNDGSFISNFNGPPQVDARGQFVAEGLLPGTYEINASYTPDMRSPWRWTKQQVVVSNGVVTNITLSIDPDAPPDRP